jgi:hypothetical protein
MARDIVSVYTDVLIDRSGIVCCVMHLAWPSKGPPSAFACYVCRQPTMTCTKLLLLCGGASCMAKQRLTQCLACYMYSQQTVSATGLLEHSVMHAVSGFVGLYGCVGACCKCMRAQPSQHMTKHMETLMQNAAGLSASCIGHMLQSANSAAVSPM